MKKASSTMLIAMLVFASLLFSYEEAAGQILGQVSGTLSQTLASEDRAVYPYALQTVEDEAFSGTSLSLIVFDQNLRTIGVKSFDNVPDDIIAFIPETAVRISDMAFGNSALLAVFGIKGSTAEDWAHRNGYPFRHCNIWHVSYLGSNQIRWQFNRVIEQFIAVLTRENLTNSRTARHTVRNAGLLLMHNCVREKASVRLVGWAKAS